MRWLRGLVLCVTIMLSSQAVMAQTCTATASGVSFGNYDPFAAGATSITGAVSVTCRAVVALSLVYTVQFNGGISGNIAARAMTSSGNRLNYQLYLDMAHTLVWGDGTGGTGVASDGYFLLALTNVTKNYTAYGLVPARQMAAPGAYGDVITVLVSY